MGPTAWLSKVTQEGKQGGGHLESRSGTESRSVKCGVSQPATHEQGLSLTSQGGKGTMKVTAYAHTTALC